MERLTGVVMERSGRHVVLFTPMGEFRKVIVTGRLPDIGEEISIQVARKHFLSAPRASWLAVAAAVILVMVASPLLNTVNQPANMAVDGTPAIVQKQPDNKGGESAEKQQFAAKVPAHAEKNQVSPSADGSAQSAVSETPVNGGANAVSTPSVSPDTPVGSDVNKAPAEETEVFVASAGNPEQSGGANKPADNKQRYLDPVRRADGPEEKPKGTENKEPAGRPAAASYSGLEKDRKPSAEAPVNQEQNSQGKYILPPDSADDQTTVDNYMGNDNQKTPQESGSDTHIFRPTF